MQYYFILLLSLFSITNLYGQSFIFNQFFRPSIRFNNSYHQDFNLHQGDRLITGQSSINCIVPIKSQLKLDIDWKKVLQLRFKKASKLKVYQIFWNFRPSVLYTNLKYANEQEAAPFGSTGRLTYGFNTGITGVHLLAKPFKRPKFLFYSINIGMIEDYQSVQKGPIPSATALVGWAHIKSLTFFWYYGFYLSYNNNQVLPAPFFGIQAKLTRKLWINITLPVQIRFAWKLSRKVKFDVGAGLAGFNTAFGYQSPLNSTLERHVFGGFRVRVGANLNIKLSPQMILYLEAGCYPYQNAMFRWNEPPFAAPDLSAGAYAGFSLFYAFKKSLLSSTIDGIIVF